MAKRIEETKADFIAWANRCGISTETAPDAWGDQEFKHPHVQSMWKGWFEAYAYLQKTNRMKASESVRFPVPEGQTPLDDKLDHPLLRVFREGERARDTNAGSPYSGHSLEHCLHATGWVHRDLQLALQSLRKDPS